MVKKHTVTARSAGEGLEGSDVEFRGFPESILRPVSSKEGTRVDRLFRPLLSPCSLPITGEEVLYFHNNVELSG